jgi:hypothetical protein
VQKPSVGYLCLPVFDGLPAGYRVVRMREDFYTNTMEFVVEHESFAQVPEGENPPLVGPGGAVTLVEYRLTPPEETERLRRENESLRKALKGVLGDLG